MSRTALPTLAMNGLPEDHVPDVEIPWPRPRRTVRELLWLPPKDRVKICSRCDLVKKSIITIQFKSERFGLCARCLESLWSCVGHDE